MVHWQKSLISFVFLSVMLAFAYLQTQAPAARADTSLDYAALSRHVSIIAARPHPIGSVANREVRDYIVEYFESLGLETEVQKATVVYRHPFQPESATAIGHVENIIARLPGTSRAAGKPVKDLVLMAHYDSRKDGPGAGDDASGTASIMEVARIMAAGPAPVHDVIFLITDGEEMGLFGAQGYFRQHPAARDVGLVLNFEARGSYGTSSMFETSKGNAWLIEQLLESIPDLNAGSLSYEIYQRMPNDTDMSISRGEGIAGLNFAFISGLYDYHASSDTPENLDKDTLAQQANYVLASAQHFANLGEWQSATGNKTYFNIWKGVVVSYGQGQAVIFGVAVLLFGLWLFVAALRSGAISWRSLGTGLLSLLALIILVSNVFESLIDYQRTADAGIARLISLGEWPLLAYFVTTLGLVGWFAHALKRGFGKTGIYIVVSLLALMCLLAGRPWLSAVVLVLILIPVLRFIGSRASPPNLWAAALVLWWLLAALALYLAPNASYMFIWPLASVLLGVALLGRYDNSRGRFVVVLASSIIPLILLPPFIVLGYLALGSTMPQGIMVLTALSLLLVWPLIRAIGLLADGKLNMAILGAGLLMTAVVVFGRGFDTRHPLGEDLFYAIDVDQQQGFWVSSDVRPGSWLSEFMGKDTSEDNMSRLLPGYDQEVLIREVPLPRFKAATLELGNDQSIDGKRVISLHLQSPVGAEYVNLLFPTDAGISSASVNGFPVVVPGVVPGTKTEADSDTKKADAMKEKDKTQSEAWWRWRWYGLPEEGADIVLTLTADRPFEVKIIEVDYGMPKGAPLRPVDSMPKPYTWSDSLVMFQTLEFD